MTEHDLSATKQIPSCVEIGLEASARGDYQLARQMLHTAMEQLDGCEDKQIRLVELISNIADTYLHEGNFDSAKNWYMRALIRCELSQGANTLRAGCLMARLAQVNALQSDLAEFKKQLDNLMHTFLLAPEESISLLLDPLVDLSWALCVKGCVPEVQSVNGLISHIKQLEEEDRLASYSAA